MLHELDPQLLAAVSDYVAQRLSYDETPLDASGSAEENAARARDAVRGSITEHGMGTLPAFDLFATSLAPLVMSADSPRFLSFIPAAPAPSAMLMDSVVAASSMQACSWFEAAGPVAAEEAAISFLCSVANLPQGSSGVFVSGGSAANLSALTVARDVCRAQGRPGRTVLVSASAHTSVARAAHILDLEVEVIPTPSGYMTCSDALDFFASHDVSKACALVVTAGTTNAGLVDDLGVAAQLAREHGLWLHVDAAYGGAALLDKRTADLFAGIEQADSITMDPHKWWFSGYDCGALLYRDPLQAVAVHTQDAAYLDAIHGEEELLNPSDLAFHLTRRARGVPFWFALASHGTRAFTDAVCEVMDRTQWLARQIESRPDLSLAAPAQLSIVLFDKEGWSSAQWWQWSQSLRDTNQALVLPTQWQGRTVGRIALLHPGTTQDMLTQVLDSIPRS